MRYREYTLSLIGFSQAELDALVAELNAYGAVGNQRESPIPQKAAGAPCKPMRGAPVFLLLQG